MTVCSVRAHAGAGWQIEIYLNVGWIRMDFIVSEKSQKTLSH